LRSLEWKKKEYKGFEHCGQPFTVFFREKGWPQGHAFGLMVARFQLSTVGAVSVLCVTARLSIGRDLGDYATLIAPTG
jgi:hypothetical protein